MPYDPRPKSKGGNRGIDEKFSRQAPPGKFRVVYVNTFDGGDGVLGDSDTLKKAQKLAEEKGGAGISMYIYNDWGEEVWGAIF